jgi:ribonuclease HI
MKPSLPDIITAVQTLSPGQRRKLYRRLRVVGLLGDEELWTDRNRLSVAPALGERLNRWPGITPGGQAEASRQVAGQPAAPLSPRADTEMKPADGGKISASYDSPVSGRVVVGAPDDAATNDPHAMTPLPGQAPEQPIGIIFDGGSKGNPGEGYGSYAVDWPGLPQQMVRLKFGSRVTNNEAEYDTLIAALEAILKRLLDAGADPGSARLVIRGDSLLVINQVKGDWQCKEPRLRMRRDRVRELLHQFGSWELIHHKREKSVEVLGH